jgi:hypothetical protein
MWAKLTNSTLSILQAYIYDCKWNTTFGDKHKHKYIYVRRHRNTSTYTHTQPHTPAHTHTRTAHKLTHLHHTRTHTCTQTQINTCTPAHTHANSTQATTHSCTYVHSTQAPTHTCTSAHSIQAATHTCTPAHSYSLVHVVVVLVIWRIRQQNTEPRTKREKHLCSRVNPHLKNKSILKQINTLTSVTQTDFPPHKVPIQEAVSKFPDWWRKTQKRLTFDISGRHPLNHFWRWTGRWSTSAFVIINRSYR